MITFKNIKSDSLGIVFSAVPSIPTGAERTQFLTVPGRDGKLTKKDDSMEPIKLTLEGHAECSRDELISYFSGSGQLIFDDYNDRYYDVRIVEPLTITYPLSNTDLIKFLVIIDSEPYAFKIHNPLVTVQKDFVVNNTTNLKAHPYIKITGAGTIVIKKNSVQILEVKNVSGYVEIDSSLNSIYKVNTSMERNSIGEVPVIDVGNNHFEILGIVHKVEIRYNWRFR